MDQQLKLYASATLMNVYFNYVPARKNKGVILQVIPRLLEGWNVKYITGSGQTTATKDRVFIYETEGYVKPFRRSKGRNRSKKNEGVVDPVANVVDSRPGPQLHAKKRIIYTSEKTPRKHSKLIAPIQQNKQNFDARILTSCSWSNNVVALARS